MNNNVVYYNKLKILKPIPIYLLSYYFEDVITGVVDRLNEVTKHPIKIIVGDNLSKNSTKIRDKLLKYKQENKIHSAYFYPENHGTKIFKHMINNECDDSEYLSFGDGDALISEKIKTCWLAEFLEILKDSKIGLVGFQSKNDMLIWATQNKKIDSVRFVSSNKEKYILHSASKVLKMSITPIRGHFITIKKKLLNLYYKANTRSGGTYDDDLQRFIAKNNYSTAQYTNSFVYNLNTIKSGYDCDGLSENYPADKSYIPVRKKISKEWDILSYPDKFEKI